MTTNEPPFAYIHRAWVIALGLIVFFLGLALLQFGANNHIAIVEKLGEVIVVVVSLHFLYEQYVKRMDRFATQKQLSDSIKPQQLLVEQLDRTISGLNGKIHDLEEKISELETRLSTSFNIIPYTDGTYFQKHWDIIVDKFDHLALIGDCPHDTWLRTIARVDSLTSGKKQLTIYTSVNHGNKGILHDIVRLQVRRGRVTIRHVERTDVSFIALGWNAKESSAQALLNHAYERDAYEEEISGSSWGGHHLFGAPALDLYKSKVLQFADHPSNELTHEVLWPALLRICDTEVLDIVAAKRAAHQNELKSLAQGVPIRGCDEICERMIQAIRTTEKSAFITHIVTTEKQIDILVRRSFRRWIQANVEAVQRGVRVTRIFLITREFLHDEKVTAIANDMRQSNIDVRYVPWEELDAGLRYDFSVYDDKRHMRITTQAGGGWGKDGTAEEEAVTTTDLQIIAKYSQMIQEIARGSRPFPVNLPVDDDSIEKLIHAESIRGDLSVDLRTS